jgi:xylan 1,4-beta-xylosidase
VNFDFERRIAMFPAGFDGEGNMFASTRFGDFPQRVPTAKWHTPEELFSGWMLLSYRKPVRASSVSEVFAASNVTDENPRSYWVAETNRAGEWLELDLGRAMEIRALQVNFTDHRSNLYASDEKVYSQFKLDVSTDGREWSAVVDLSGEKKDRPNGYFELPKAVRGRFVRYEHLYVGSPNLAISDIRVFGNGGGSAPAVPGKVAVWRDGNDLRNARVSWEPVAEVVGYNVLWGISPDKLYQCYQVFADGRSAQEIRALTLGQSYSFCVEAFNESGVSARSEVVSVK